MSAIIDRFIQVEPQFGRMADREPPPQLAADKATGAFQPFFCLLEFYRVAAQAVKVYVCVLIIGTDACTGNGHALQSRILDAALNDVTQFALNQIGDSFLTSEGQR